MAITSKKTGALKTRLSSRHSNSMNLSRPKQNLGKARGMTWIKDPANLKNYTEGQIYRDPNSPKIYAKNSNRR